MTLSDLRPARRALPLALALACASIALPAAAQGLQTSFEPGQPAVLTRDFPLGPELAQCCGGRMALRFELFTPDQAQAVAARAQADETDVATPLALFGAGHVGRALVLALAPLPFRIRWIDQRADAFPALAPPPRWCAATPRPKAPSPSS